MPLPPRIDVIDNGGQWTHREWRMLRDLEVDTQIIPNDTPLTSLREDLDGLLLSGGAARIGLTGELGACGEYLTLNIPIFGICAGHQFMAIHYGGSACPSPHPEFGAVEITTVNDSILFQNTPEVQQAFTSHNDEVDIVPDGFIVTATSETCSVQAMECLSNHRFGVQFHPEVTHTEHGSRIIANFVEYCQTQSS